MESTGGENAVICPVCGVSKPRDHQYCMRCGAGLSDQPPPLAGEVPVYPHQAYPPPRGAYPADYPPYAPVQYVMAPPQSPSATSDVEKYLLPVNRTPLSIVCGYLGLFCLVFWPLGFICAPLSLFALHQLGKNPEKMGRGRAVFGLVAGVFGIVVLLIILALQGS